MSCAKYGWNMPIGFGEEDKMSVVYDDDNDNDEQRTYFDTFSSGELKTDATNWCVKLKSSTSSVIRPITQTSVIIREGEGGFILLGK